MAVVVTVDVSVVVTVVGTVVVTVVGTVVVTVVVTSEGGASGAASSSSPGSRWRCAGVVLAPTTAAIPAPIPAESANAAKAQRRWCRIPKWANVIPDVRISERSRSEEAGNRRGRWRCPHWRNW